MIIRTFKNPDKFWERFRSQNTWCPADVSGVWVQFCLVKGRPPKIVEKIRIAPRYFSSTSPETKDFFANRQNVKKHLWKELT